MRTQRRICDVKAMGGLAVLVVAVASASAAAPPPDTASPAPVTLDLPAECQRQFDALAQQLSPSRRAWFEKVAGQAYRREALILPGDRDPVDVVLRRTEALLQDVRRQGSARYDLSGVDGELRVLRADAELSPPQVRQVPRGRTDVTEVVNRNERMTLFQRACALRRRVMLANPLLDFSSILFCARTPLNGHSANVYYGFHTSGQAGGGIYVLEAPFGPKATVRNLLAGRKVAEGRLKGQELLPGAFGWPDLSYDGKTVVFAYTQGKPDRNLPAYMGWCETASFHLFKASVEGAGAIAQVTDGVDDDAHPCWLPDGRIAFISTRRGGANRCGGPQKVNTLHSVNDDGSNLVCLSFHETNEWSPSVRPDGMLLYSRWDYVDRGDCIAHHPWICYPDGRDPRALHGNYPVARNARPDLEADLQPIPGSRKIVGTASGHHGPGLSGSLIILDADIEDDNAMAQVKRLTPETPFPEVEGGGGDFATPWPLSEDHFLCSHRGGLYLIDSFGNRELLFRAQGMADCMDPVPLRPRQRPPVIPVATSSQRPKGVAALAGGEAKEDDPATVACINVYDSAKPWPAGTKISALRIVQVFPKQHGTWMGFPEIGRTAESLARGVLGTVPVEKDGSVHFTCPPNKLIYFQALDEQGRAVQSMQSGTYLHPGQTLVCQGCHERRAQGPSLPAQRPLAMRRAPSALKPGVDGSYPVLFPRLVQPVLDKHCVACHREKNPKMDLSGAVVEVKKGRESGPRVDWCGAGTYWSKSYLSLSGQGFGFSGKPPGRLPAETTPGRFGALASRLYPVLTTSHKGRISLSPEDWHRIVLWLDCNSNFLGAYHQTEEQAQGKSVMPKVQ